MRNSLYLETSCILTNSCSSHHPCQSKEQHDTPNVEQTSHLVTAKQRNMLNSNRSQQVLATILDIRNLHVSVLNTQLCKTMAVVSMSLLLTVISIHVLYQVTWTLQWWKHKNERNDLLSTNQLKLAFLTQKVHVLKQLSHSLASTHILSSYHDSNIYT